MEHILERGLIHFFSSASLVIIVYFLLKYWVRKNAKVGIWISSRKTHLLFNSALIVSYLATFREPIDMSNQGTAIKSICDMISWLLGSATSVFGLYRYDKE